MTRLAGANGSRLDDLVAGLSDQLTLLYGVRPGDPRADLNGNVLAFTFEGGLSGSDELLLEAGHDQRVREFHEHFLQAASEQLAGIVSSFTGASVAFFFAAFNPGSRTTNCFFMLEAQADAQLEQREAIRNWSEQVQRNARDLRARHAAMRAEHKRLREALEQTERASARLR
jgi:uncharacterized protein YbcI